MLVLEKHDPDELKHLPRRYYLLSLVVLAQVVDPILELVR